MRVHGKVALLFAALAATAGADELRPPVKLEAGGAPIDVEVGHAAPFVHDLDGDGVPDLLVGQFGGGKLRWFRNEGAAAAPRLAASQWVQTIEGKPAETESG
ncbi:MAG: VCBS repeat-containing protein [Planctomycetes bacterium]|nr:VCBS repeat-containing protein [Planctomycetota bacterium]